MPMTPAVRKFTYTAHLTSSIGWIGAVFVFVAMAALALTSRDERVVRGAYLIMAPAAWFVLVPLAHASLLTGIALSLGTAWGLFRHYWVVLKLGITVFCTVILMIYMGTFRQMAGLAAAPVVNMDTVRNASPVLHASIALLLLFVATVLGVYKPFGLTAYGWRKQMEPRSNSFSGALHLAAPQQQSMRTAAWIYVAGIAAVALFLLLVIMHLVAGGTTHH